VTPTFRDVLQTRRFLVVAHRGASAYAPENTLEAFELACTLGADVIELDVHLTHDGEVVVMHDDGVDRTTDGRGEIRTKTTAEIRGLDAGAWFGEQFRGVRVPLLSEVLERFAPRVLIDIELKAGVTVGWPSGVSEYTEVSTALATRLIEVTQRAGAAGRVIVSSAGIHGLTRVREIAPDIPVQWSVYTLDIAAEAAAAADAGVDVISPQDYAATDANLARAHSRGLAVHIYTRGEDERMAKLIDMGTDAVKTGRPDVLRAVAVRLGRA